MNSDNYPVSMSICEQYGLSGNCGERCPKYIDKSCEVYEDVKIRLLEEENKQQKENIQNAIEYIKENKLKRYRVILSEDYDEEILLDEEDINELLVILEGSNNK